MSVSQMIGPILGGAIDQTFGWRWIFALMATAAALVLLLMWFVLPETLAADKRSKNGSWVANVTTLLVIPAFWAYALTAASISGVWFSFLAGAPFIATEFLGLDPVDVGVCIAVTAIGYFIGNFTSGRFSERLGAPFMVACGNSIQLTVTFLMVIMFSFGWLNIWTFFIPVTIISISNGIALPNAIASSLSVRPALAGTASGFGGSIQFGIGALSVAIVGFSLGADPSALTLAGVMAFFALTGAITSLWSRFASD